MLSPSRFLLPRFSEFSLSFNPILDPARKKVKAPIIAVTMNVNIVLDIVIVIS